MKAVICPKYGPPEVLTIKEIPKPTPKKNEVLIKIMAASVNTGDARIRGLRASGLMKCVLKFVIGFTKPRKPILGTVFSGVVEEIGEAVTKFKLGDEVYGSTGMQQGTHAEFICISEKKAITHKPKNASFEEAAALPFGGQTAIYFLRKGTIESIDNPNVLIYGASGSVGVASVQIAKHYGAKVTGVCSSKNKELVKSIGADNIILYDKEDFTQCKDTFDIIFDCVGKTSKKQCKSLLKSHGKYFTVEGLDVASERTDYLEFLCDLYENENYQAVIDKVYPMEEIVEVHRYIDTGRKKGNVILKIA